MERVFNLTYVDMNGIEVTVSVVATSPLDAYKKCPPHQRVLWVAELKEQA